MSNPAVSGTNYAVVNALLQAKGRCRLGLL